MKTLIIIIIMKSFNLCFSTVYNVEMSEPSVEPGTIISMGLDIHVFINMQET